MGMQGEVKELVNVKWVSVPIGSEHFAFHIKNSFEEQLFKQEDERYEFDMYI